MATDKTARILLKKSEVLTATGLSFPTIWKLMRQGKFPLPVLPSAETPRWFSDEISSWQDGLIRAEYKPIEGAKNEANGHHR